MRCICKVYMFYDLQVTYTHVAQAVRSQRVASNKQPPSQSAAYANTASQSQPNPKQGSSQHKPVADSASCSTGSTIAIQYRPLSGKALCVYCPLADSARGGSGGSNGSGSVSGSGSGLAASLGAGPSSAALQSGLQAHKAALEKLVQVCAVCCVCWGALMRAAVCARALESCCDGLGCCVGFGMCSGVCVWIVLWYGAD